MDSDFWRILSLNGDDNESMLTDDHMYYFQNLIINFNMQNTNFKELIYNIERNPPGRLFIQILFSGPNNAGHWICVWYDGRALHVYDSLNGKLNYDHKKYINRLLPNIENIPTIYEIVQIQSKSFDCGVFAIVFATCITKNICPCS